MKTKKRTETDSAGMSFEQSMKRLEGIVDSLEKGEVTLDEALNLYEEGLTISKQCLEKLTAAEARLKILGKDISGKLRVFDEQPEK